MQTNALLDRCVIANHVEQYRPYETPRWDVSTARGGRVTATGLAGSQSRNEGIDGSRILARAGFESQVKVKQAAVNRFELGH